jgi:hypothetical protein
VVSCAVEVLEDGNGDEDRGGSDEDGGSDEVGGSEVRGGEDGGGGDDDNGGEEDGLWARLAAVDWANFDIISSCRFFFDPRFGWAYSSAWAGESSAWVRRES